MSAKHFLEELSERVDQFEAEHKRRCILIAESDLNDVRIIRPRRHHGYGMDAQWCDDFHHALHALLTGESNGYYEDFGKITHLKAAMKDGFTYSWNYSRYRKRYFGSKTTRREARQFVVFSQNHDQVGNRADGKRLAGLVSFDALKLAAGAVILSPFIPLLFMGEEYGEKSPFYYFVSHSDPDLIDAVRKGRKDEFISFGLKEDFSDPQDEKTFLKSKISWSRREEGEHRILLDFYKELIRLRKHIPALETPDKDALNVEGVQEKKLLIVERNHEKGNVLCVFNFGEKEESWESGAHRGKWTKLFDSAEKIWLGPGSDAPGMCENGRSVAVSPFSFVVYVNTRGE
jgi:maltooligosyltrehalose trehalohydrolase